MESIDDNNDEFYDTDGDLDESSIIFSSNSDTPITLNTDSSQSQDKSKVDESSNDKFLNPNTIKSTITNLEEKTDEFYDTDADLDESNAVGDSVCGTPSTYYAVQFLDKSKIDDSCKRIFVNRNNALSLCKKHVNYSRFKSFKNFNEAYAFSYDNDSKVNSSIIDSPIAIPKNKDKEYCPFKRPDAKELNKLRSHIEKNEVDLFKSKVLSNPLFIITIEDTPTVVHPGCHYNCFHVCATRNNYEIASFLLDRLSDINFIRSIYPNADETIGQLKCRSNRVLDFYLNMPEKGLSETPLHFACKCGSYEVVKLFASYKHCSKSILNKKGEKPFDVICTKLQATDIELTNKIRSLFEDCYYVPFYREDEGCETVIEKPVFDEAVLIHSPITDARTKKLTAFIGPTSPSKANIMYERLKSPSSRKQSPNHIQILRKEDYKGYERIARIISEEMSIPWTEYWEFLDCYCNLKTNEGLLKMELYFMQKKFNSFLEVQSKSCQEIIKIEKSKENDDNKSVIIEDLNKLLVIIDNIKTELEIKENQLSSKFEQIQLLLHKSDIEIKSQLKTNKCFCILCVYLSTIVHISKIDTSSICYFYLYKSSKIILNLLNCSKYMNDNYLLPFFKKLQKNKQHQHHHQSTSILSKYRDRTFEMKKNLMSLNYGDDDDDDENQDLKELCAKMKSQTLNDYNYNDYLDRIANSTIARAFNSVVKQRVQRFFIYGDVASKYDRATYLAMKGANIDATKYPLLNEWYTYISTQNIDDIQQWKSPLRKPVK